MERVRCMSAISSLTEKPPERRGLCGPPWASPRDFPRGALGSARVRSTCNLLEARATALLHAGSRLVPQCRMPDRPQRIGWTRACSHKAREVLAFRL